MDFELYSIMRLDKEHINEICEDIENQVKNDIATCALFSMTLHAEGIPVFDKVTPLCETYLEFKKILDSKNVPNGVLVQATMGHGYKLNAPKPFTKYLGLEKGETREISCPYDEGFRQYAFDIMKKITECNPDIIMVDDDFRLMTRGVNRGGCCCDYHLKKFNELAKTNLSRDELRDIILNEKDQRLKEIYIETQKDSILGCAKMMRKGVDSVNKKMQVAYCCVGNNAEFATEVEGILAGEGNRKIIRIGNGNYCKPNAIYITDAFHRAASQIAKIKDKTDLILAETDTCPQNRYSTSASQLHSHFTGSLLEGACGAKQWITRLSAFEPQSGTAYRKILSEYSGFYRELAKIVPSLSWEGFKIPLSKKPQYFFNNRSDNSVDESNSWSLCVFERLGLPMYFSAEKGGVTCLEGNCDRVLTDDELKQSLSEAMLISSDSALNLINRGFGKYLGVDIRDYKGEPASFEMFDNNKMDMQIGFKELVPTSEKTKVISYVYNGIGAYDKKVLFPAVTEFVNELGGKIFVFCGTPKANYTHTEAFSFLNYTRKKQLVSILNPTVYYDGDEEVYFRLAKTENDELFCSVFNLSFDKIEEITLVCRKNVSSIKMLNEKGEKVDVDFTKDGDKYTVKTPCEILIPVILFLK